MSGGANDFHRYISEGDYIAVFKNGSRFTGSETESFLNKLPPVIPVRVLEIVPVEKDSEVTEGRRILPANSEGNISKEVEISEVILMPVAQPYLLDSLLIPDFSETILVRGRVDDDSRSLNIDGIAVGISAPFDAGDKPHGSKMLFVRLHGETIWKEGTCCQELMRRWYFLDLLGNFSYSPSLDLQSIHGEV
jgi:hypothetical protein